ncbi:hypothetical protein FACS1894217_04020 [Clostridia bacterium]|nr:hypothetical protein FACS1894217_04020 [Clostridia bacterium]
MACNFSTQETLNTLKAIFERHKDERICVIGTTCAGKTTLVNLLADYHCVDMDAVLWPNLPEHETAHLNELLQKPWCKELGDEVDRLTYKYLKAEPGCPLFSSVIVDCEAVVYLDITDDLLLAHCKKRNVAFEDAQKMKVAIEGDWNNHKAKNDKTFYCILILE